MGFIATCFYISFSFIRHINEYEAKCKHVKDRKFWGYKIGTETIGLQYVKKPNASICVTFTDNFNNLLNIKQL